MLRRPLLGEYQRRKPRQLIPREGTGRAIGVLSALRGTKDLVFESQVGQILDGRYVLQRLLSHDTTSDTYLAKVRANGQRVAVRVIAPRFAGQAQSMRRFERELRRIDQFDHSNIAGLIDYGRDGSQPFMVQEYVEGESLSDYLSRLGSLSLAEFTPIAAQILKAVGHAHARVLMIHDIRPASVMLCERKGRANFVKLIHFGLAMFLEGEEDITRQHFIGAPGYLAPEQIKGVEVDIRTDVYALGVLFYEMLAGRLPFEAQNDTTMLYKTVHEFPAPLPELLPDDHDIPDELMHLIHDCLEKDPYSRPRDANEIVERLIDCVPMQLFKLPDAPTALPFSAPTSALSTSTLDDDIPPASTRPPAPAGLRVIRGGGWKDDARMHRAACRSWYNSDRYSDDLGFRLVRVREADVPPSWPESSTVRIKKP